MKVLSHVAPLLALVLVAVSQEPRAGEKTEPTVAVSVLEVRATAAAALSTRRLSYRFEFAIVRVIDDGAGVTGSGGVARADKIDYGCFQGFDEQMEKDAAERLLELLDGKPSEGERDFQVERPFVLGDSGVLRLTLIDRQPGLGDLWVLERSDGRRVTLAIKP